MTRAALLLLSFLLISRAAAQEPAAAVDREADKTALRAIGARFESAINQGDLTGLADDLTPGASAVFVTGEECRGLPAMRAYYDSIRAMLGAGGKYGVKLRPADTEFTGDTAIASGISAEKVTTGTGAVYSFESKWTAVLLKRNGRWLAARVHVSLDPVNNPLVAAKYAAAGWVKAAAGLLIGLAAGWLVGRVRRGSSKASQTP